MMKLLLVTAATLILSAPLAAQDAIPAAAKPKAERKICRSEGETGSRFEKKICRTQDEWAQIDAASQSNARNMTRNGGYRDMNRQ